MFSRIFRRSGHGESIATALYGAIVAQARKPALYAVMGVPDTVEGRFEMVVLHTVLVTRQLKSAGETTRAAGQGVFDNFCKDMDHSLRELGVGDLSVPKRMRQIGEAFFGRAAAYEPGLDAESPDILAAAIRRTVFDGKAESSAARELAAYAIAAAKHLKTQSEESIMTGAANFPDVEPFAAGRPLE